MTLANKYLRYSPEITFEIFKLVWDKFEQSGYDLSAGINTIFENWKTWIYIIIEDNNIRTTNRRISNLLEITVQEILGYDPFVNKEVIPEYVECVSWFGSSFTPSKIYKVVNGKVKDNYGNHDITDWNHGCFRPSSKSAFDAQNQQKSIEKWSVGSYVVFLKDLMHINAGYIDVIEEALQNDSVYLEKYLALAISRERSGEVKWFATKSEAEEFAKTLVESVKKEVKQPLKQAVHCKTQEEWDFVTEKLGYKWAQHCSFSAFSESTCISLIDTQYSYVDYLKNDYQILSFQKWCDLNGYKMEKEVKFEVGQLVWISSKPMNGNGMDLSGKDDGVYRLMDLDSPEFATGHLLKNSHFKFKCGKNYFKTNIKNIRHATPEEINNHLISIGQIPAEPICTNTNSSRHDGCGEKYGCIQNCDECNYYQIPAGEPLNTGIEPNKDGMFKYTTYAGTIHVGKCSTVSGPLKITLSIDDEELPMVSIIKTNSIKQLLNIE